MLKYETRLIVSGETSSLNQLIRKPPKKFCKQKISDSLKERIILTNDNITYEALDVLFVYDVIRSGPRGQAEKKKSINLLQSENAGLTPFR